MIGIITDSATGDLVVEGGGISVGEIAPQCACQLTVSAPGEYKEFPLIGGDARRLLHGSGSRFWPGRVSAMCAAMGVPVRRVSLDNLGNLTVAL